MGYIKYHKTWVVQWSTPSINQSASLKSGLTLWSVCFVLYVRTYVRTNRHHQQKIWTTFHACAWTWINYRKWIITYECSLCSCLDLVSLYFTAPEMLWKSDVALLLEMLLFSLLDTTGMAVETLALSLVLAPKASMFAMEMLVLLLFSLFGATLAFLFWYWSFGWMIPCLPLTVVAI